MKFRKTISLPFFFFLIFASAQVAEAGFGVTPPFVRNTSLTRNSIYEQKIILVRATPDQPLQAEISVDAPEVADWITIVEGESLLLPRGEQKVPITVRVEVPDDAEFKQYDGNIRVKTGSVDEGEGRGAVNISLGAQIDLELNVIDREIKDFRIRRVNLADLNAGHSFGWLYFPGRIQFKMLLENTGNVDISPSEVKFSIYDPAGRVLLEEVSHKGRIGKVEPYATDEIVAHLPTRLPAGTYLARYEIYNGDEVKQSGELNMNILPHGTVQAAGFGFTGLSMPHKLSVILPIFSILFIFVLFWYARRNQRQSKS